MMQRSPALKRALFPLRGPRWITLAWWPVHAACAAVDGFFEAFFACFPDRKPHITFFSTLPDRVPEDVQ